MNLSCALEFSSSFICSQYFNESNGVDIFQLHFYKRDLMNICLRQLETYRILCEFFQVKNLHMTLQGCDYLSLMLFSQNSGCMDSKSLNSIIILV